MQARVRPEARIRVPEMEGVVARWYANLRGTPSQIRAYRRQAVELTARLRDGAHVLEVAPGPGYLAIEIARLQRFAVTGLDVSRTMVAIANEIARSEGVSADFHLGDAAVMPFADASFDLIICQAAFKNFTQPESALDEMYRVLRAGGTAVIQDMAREASHTDIEQEVRQMELGRVSSFMTVTVLEWLRRRAYAADRFERLAASSRFHASEIHGQGITLEVRMKKPVH